MKTTVCIPDPIFYSGERLAIQMKTSRSQLYSQALEEYIDRHDPDKMTERINTVCDKVDTRPGPLLTHAARRVLAETDR